MNKPERILYCYSQEDFDGLMKELGWKEPNEKSSTVSICSPWNEHFEHYFKSGTPNNYNIDRDDIVRPFWWNKDYYDIAEKMYLDGQVKESNELFNFYKEDGNGKHLDLRLFNYEQAFLLAAWINVQMLNGHDNFYVHCAAGLSRSQAVVRFILDTYSADIHWKTRKSNPCTYYNNHILLMLKRAARHLNIL